MERLTMIDGRGNDELVRCMSCGLEKAGADLEHCGMCEEGWQRALKKLAAYEDTGLEPEDITRAFDETTILQLAGSVLGVPPDRLRELAKADREPVETPRKTAWISVEDRLPKDRGDVLVVAFWHERWGVYMGWCAPERSKWSVHVGLGDRSDVAVSHWMPLPEPPKEN